MPRIVTRGTATSDMSLRIPTAIENHGDGRRLSQATGAFIVWLTTYPPVQTYYLDTWRVVHARTDQEFTLLLAEHPETIELFKADVAWRDHTATVPFVRTLLHRLPATWVDMTTAELLRAFRTVYHHTRTPADQRPAEPMFGVGVQLTASHPRGRVSEDPAAIQRGVHWLCRAYVPERPDTQRFLAREYAAAVRRNGFRNDPLHCRRDVQRSIDQAWALLDLAAALPWSPTQPGRIVLPDPSPKKTGDE
jgi:hypothetical protein